MSRLHRKLRAWRRAVGLRLAGETRISIPVAVQSVDPATASALLLAQADTIAALVRRA